jgi:GMP synthase-like glutamine amidotransferase
MFAPLHWHGDTVELPPTAELLASSERYPNQAFRVGARAWGIQFHVEADRPLVEAFVGEWPQQADDPAALLSEADARLAALAPTASSVLGRFAAMTAGGGDR